MIRDSAQQNATARNATQPVTKRKRPKRPPHWQLKELRINKGMSPNQLAVEAGVTGNTVRLAEAGWTPSVRTQFAIAAVFDLKPLDLWPLPTGGRR